MMLSESSSSPLKKCIQRLEALEDEKIAILEQIRDVFSEAKSEGFDPKIIRKVLKIRKMKAEDVKEEEALVEQYLQALQA
jgi:uncharacterized protein (UPF0335 family)